MSKLADKVQQELIQAIDNDDLVLPTLPEVALKVREAAEDPNIGTPQLSKVIGNDAALTARIIKVVNSPLLRTNKEITDLQMAVSRLGINYTCNLATGLAMEQMFQATSDVVDRKMREVWNKSTEVAAISHVLCRHYTRLMPDQATLAGLVHQIGILPILTYAEEHSALLSDSFSLNHVIDKIHPMVGEKILRTWDFPEAIVSVAGQYTDFQRNSAAVDYVDVVQVATLQSYMGTQHPYAQLDWSEVPAFAKLGLDPISFRQANVIRDDAYPATGASGIKLEVLSHEASLQKLRELMNYDALRAEQAAKLGDLVVHRYAPLDYPWAVAAFLKRIKPRALWVMETELWPNWLAACETRHLPVTIINARLSERSCQRYARFQGAFDALSRPLTHLLCQHQDDADRFHRLGIGRERLAVKVRSLTVPG